MLSNIQHEIRVFHNNLDYNRVKIWFWPIVIGISLFFGFLDGIQGAFVGFLYGVVAGLFLIHESLSVNKKVT